MKESIEFLKELDEVDHENYPMLNFGDKLKKIISLLQQGEALKAENVELKAYKKMWEATIEITYPGRFSLECLTLITESIKRKYFPKKRMETKEAIELIKHDLDLCLNDGIDKDDLFKAIDNIEDELQQGEAYRLIVRDVEIILLPAYFIDHAPELERFRRLFKETKQKYFPEDKLIQE